MKQTVINKHHFQSSHKKKKNIAIKNRTYKLLRVNFLVQLPLLSKKYHTPIIIHHNVFTFSFQEIYLLLIKHV